MKALLVLTAALEVVTGLGLLAVPATIVTQLLGRTPDAPESLVIARVAGAAVFALGLICWHARTEPHARATVGIVMALLSYNVAVAALVAYAGIRLGLSGKGLWPAVGLHLVLAAGCIACLLGSRTRTSRRESISSSSNLRFRHSCWLVKGRQAYDRRRARY